MPSTTYVRDSNAEACIVAGSTGSSSACQFVESPCKEEIEMDSSHCDRPAAYPPLLLAARRCCRLPLGPQHIAESIMRLHQSRKEVGKMWKGRVPEMLRSCIGGRAEEWIVSLLQKLGSLRRSRFTAAARRSTDRVGETSGGTCGSAMHL
jgi:hypothetical protein